MQVQLWHALWEATKLFPSCSGITPGKHSPPHRDFLPLRQEAVLVLEEAISDVIVLLADRCPGWKLANLGGVRGVRRGTGIPRLPEARQRQQRRLIHGWRWALGRTQGPEALSLSKSSGISKIVAHTLCIHRILWVLVWRETLRHGNLMVTKFHHLPYCQTLAYTYIYIYISLWCCRCWVSYNVPLKQNKPSTHAVNTALAVAGYSLVCQHPARPFYIKVLRHYTLHNLLLLQLWLNKS